jgi:hypothetical protein
MEKTTSQGRASGDLLDETVRLPLTAAARDALAKCPASAPVVLAIMEKMETQLRAIVGVIDAHECTCFSCDRDGETYCDCLEKEAAKARSFLSPNAKGDS